MTQQEGLDVFRNTAIEAALAIATIIPSFALAKTVTLNPDEASSKDTFDYAFQIPDILGIPGSPNRLDFDTENIPGRLPYPSARPSGSLKPHPSATTRSIPQSRSGNTRPGPCSNST